ncbi:hypothetical protein G7Z13_03545 [Streptomyces sp. JB150]|nr:hypothetical protein G7Z13_03545 [Streptomyces sp. JB150]
MHTALHRSTASGLVDCPASRTIRSSARPWRALCRVRSGQQPSGSARSRIASTSADAILDRVADAPGPAGRLTAFAAVVRHLVADPVLPGPLLPDDWPGAELRAAYADYRRELAEQVHARVEPR